MDNEIWVLIILNDHVRTSSPVYTRKTAARFSSIQQKKKKITSRPMQESVQKFNSIFKIMHDNFVHMKVLE